MRVIIITELASGNFPGGGSFLPDYPPGPGNMPPRKWLLLQRAQIDGPLVGEENDTKQGELEIEESMGVESLEVLPFFCVETD